MSRAASWIFAGAMTLTVPLAAFSAKAMAPFALLAAAGAAIALARAGGLAAAARQPIAAVVTALAAWALISAGWAVEGADAFGTTIGGMPFLYAGLLLVVAARDVAAPPSQTQLLAAAAGLALGALVAIDHQHGHFLHATLWGLTGRSYVFGTARVNAALAMLALLAWPAGLLLWRAGWRWLALGLVALALAAIADGNAVTVKLAALAALAGGAAAYAFGRRAVQAMVALFVGGVFVAPLLPRTLLQPALHEGWLGPLSLSALHRLHIWKFVARRIADRPLRGWGMDASRALPGGEAPVIANGQALPLHPHNAALQMWLELGLPGALAFALLTLLVGRAVWSIDGDRLARASATATLVVALVVLSASFGVWQNWWLGALALAAGTVAFAAAERAR